MFKLYALLIAIGGGYMWLRRKRYNASHNKSIKRLAKHLDASESFESLSASLDVAVRNKPLPVDFDLRKMDRVKQVSFTGEAEKKFQLVSTRSNGKGDAVVIANGKGKDLLPTRYGVKEIDRVFPCPLFISCNREEGRMVFYSMFPEDKEHQFFLEDLSDHLFEIVNRES
jgi:hypothetical protein